MTSLKTRLRKLPSFSRLSYTLLMPRLDSPLRGLSKITPAYAKLLDNLGIFTVRDLLFYFPFRYDDFSKMAAVSPENLGETITVQGMVRKTTLKRIFKRKMTIIEASIEVPGEDSMNTPLKAIWFNQSFVLSTVKEGVSVRLSGKLELKGRTFQMISPAFERASRDATNTGRLVPVYKETKGLTSKWLRWQIKSLIALSQQIPEIVPKEIYEKFHLYSLPKAIQEIHFPTSSKNLERAQKTFAFQEMLLLQIKAIQTRNSWNEKKSEPIKFEKKEIQNFNTQLPFSLTNAQKKASFEILKDLEKNQPMNRLLNGDVGSGKTVVAAISALPPLLAKKQVAIMAPTEVLARQHFESFCQLFKAYNFNIALLTNSYKLTNLNPDPKSTSQKNARNDLLKKISEGEIGLVIGTHALIQKDVHFKNLALVIIDEQHRFGVTQRATLQDETMSLDDGQQKTIPHLLTMTATPIPRTLAISFFGSLVLSLLDEMPKDRKPIQTKIVPPNARESAYRFIRKEIEKDRQVFIILPLVEESESLKDLRAVKVEHARLAKEVFPDLSLGLLHGKMKAKDKEKVMEDFKERKNNILVATSVVEVGIDIPNASVIMIEHAERFGLSQLHQFRGRVGRGEHQSYCFLMTDSGKEKAWERLGVLEETNDGFQIAERDLKLRGPGQFFGTLQSGLPDITMENLGNMKLIKFARAEAEDILKKDPKLENYPEIKKSLERFERQVHLE